MSSAASAHATPPQLCILMSLLYRLKDYRQTRSAVEQIPLYCVFADTVLHSIARVRPATARDLHAIRGLTPEKCDQYGADILRLVQTSAPDPPPPAFGPFLRGGGNDSHTRIPSTGFKRRLLQRCLQPPPTASASRPPRAQTAQPAVIRHNPPGSPPEDQIYILELAQGRVYVGRTSDLSRRLMQHLAARGSSFTQAFPPTGALLPRLGRVSGSAEAAERDETLRYMHLRGIPLVRGWKYTRVAMSDAEELDAEANIRELFDLCRRCGHKGHFIGQCRAGLDRRGRPC
jgi:predicted GIY-YIG superfamily endonuclease